MFLVRDYIGVDEGLRYIPGSIPRVRAQSTCATISTVYPQYPQPPHLSRRRKQRQLQTRDGSNVGSGTGLPIIAGASTSRRRAAIVERGRRKYLRGGRQGTGRHDLRAFLGPIEDQIVAPPCSRIPPWARTKERCSGRSTDTHMNLRDASIRSGRGDRPRRPSLRDTRLA